MKYEEFEQQIREMIPQPSAAITDALYRMGVEALEEKPQELLIAFEFISRHFRQNVLQGAYEIIQYGSAALPSFYRLATHPSTWRGWPTMGN